MAKLYRCSCGTAYELEENKKYKCKKCGAIMSLSAAAPAVAKAPAAGTRASAGSTRPTARAGAGTTRPGARTGATGAAGRRAGARGNPEGAGEEKKGLPTGAKIGIGIFIGVALILIIVMMSGGSEEPVKTTKGTKGTGANGEGPDKPVTPVKEPPKEIPIKKLTGADLDNIRATMKSAEENKNPKPLYDILTKAKEENWEFGQNFKDDINRVLLRLNPQDPIVTGNLGLCERNKLNYDNWMARIKKAEADKNVAALKKEVDFCFENNMYTNEQCGLDYILVYKAILRVDPNDHEARVARKLDPYDGIIQEYKGKLLTSDVYCQVKEMEWKIKQDQGK